MGKKRKYGGKNNRKSKKPFEYRPYEIDLTKNKKVIAATCVTLKEGPCQQELVLSFQEIADKFFPLKTETPLEKSKKNEDTNNGKNDSKENEKEEEKKAENNKPVMDISKGLEAELKMLTKNSETTRVQFIRAPRGQVHIHCMDKTLNPLDLVLKYFEQASDETNVGKYVIRLIPMQTCFAKTKEIVKLFTKLIKEHNFDNVNTFAVSFRHRSSGHIKRDDLIKQLADLVPERLKVNIGKPDVVLLVNANGRLGGGCIVDGKIFKKYKDFNYQKWYEETFYNTQQTPKKEEQDISASKPIEAPKTKSVQTSKDE